MRFGLADLIDDQHDCECGGGKWVVKSPTYATCDPGPVTTGYYWSKPEQRCKSPFDKSQMTQSFIGPACPPDLAAACPSPGSFDPVTCECNMPVGGCPPGMSCPPGQTLTYYRGSCYCKGGVPSWAVPAAVAAGFLALFLIVSR